RPRRGPREVERVQLVPRGVVLRLEEGVEVPERRLDEIPVDFGEAHAQEDPPDLREIRAEDVSLPRPDERGEGARVVPPELDLFPLPRPQQVRRRLCDFFLQIDAGGEDPLARGRHGDLPPHGLSLAHEIAARLEVSEALRVDRSFGEYFLREAAE